MEREAWRDSVFLLWFAILLLSLFASLCSVKVFFFSVSIMVFLSFFFSFWLLCIISCIYTLPCVIWKMCKLLSFSEIRHALYEYWHLVSGVVYCWLIGWSIGVRMSWWLCVNGKPVNYFQLLTCFER